MEARLRPINAVLGLVQAPHDINPAALVEAGFTLEGLEVPVATDVGPQSVVRASQVTLQRRVQPSKLVVYACLTEHRDRIRLGLTEAGVDFPILSVSIGEITLSSPSTIPPEMAEAFAAPVRLSGPPPSFIKFDQDSPVEVVVPLVRAQLVAALAHHRSQISLPWLTEQCAPHYPLYGRSARSGLVRVVTEAARMVAEEEPTTFAFLPRRPNDDAAVRLLKTPEDLDRRGRTQAYQALARGSRPRRRGMAPPPGQLDLLGELGAIDDGNSADEGDDGEEGAQ